MNRLSIPPRAGCRYDCVALGEVMLRLDPGWSRVREARHFDVWEGGGEYNVARALSRSFGLRTGVVTALPDNEIGHLVEGLIQAGGVDTSLVRWHQHDGVGRNARVGLNFTEKGYGIRPARSVYDRGHSATSHLVPEELDWQSLFADQGVRWLHTGGIFAGLSDASAEVLLEAVRTAKAHGTVVSYDLNYRASLWQERGGQARAVEVNREVARYVDVMLGNEEDFTAALGFEVADLDPEISKIDPANFIRMMAEVTEHYPNLAIVGTTLRNARTANINDWGAVVYADGQAHQARLRNDLEIYDRVGGGDGFASGLAYALMAGKPPSEAVEYGAAHGALVQTTPGDTSMVTAEEVEAAIGAKTARVIR